MTYQRDSSNQHSIDSDAYSDGSVPDQGPIVKRIAQFNIGTTRHYWVGLGEPINYEDMTMPEVTHRYATKRTLLIAIYNGTAYLTRGIDET